VIKETYIVDSKTSFDIDIEPIPAPAGKKYPVVVLIHGNFGLREPYGGLLRSFASEIGVLGYVAALPTYYPAGFANPDDTDIDAHSPALVATIKHLSTRTDADITRLALVGFSLGGGIALSYINSAPAGSVLAFANLYGLVGGQLSGGVTNVPPTIMFSHTNDPFVPPTQNAEPFGDALSKAGIAHEPTAPYAWYKDDKDWGGNHAFRPGSTEDIDSRTRTKGWLAKYVPPVGLP
jgi:dienelactone hydrolase